MFRIVVFSKMSGSVTLNGQPVEGAKITRTADHYHDKVYTQTTLSDDKGHYQFDEIVKWSFSVRDWFFDTRVYQEINIEYDGKNHIGWQAFKNNRHAYGELRMWKEQVTKREITCGFRLEKSDKTKTVFQIDDEVSRITRTITGICEVTEP